MRWLLLALVLLACTGGAARARRGQISPSAGTGPYVLHLPGNDPQTLLLYWEYATAGTSTLTLNGQTTAPIAFTASANDVKAALSALTGFAGKVTVGGENGGPFTVVIAAGTPVTSSSINVTGLSGGQAVSGGFASYPGAHVDHGHFWGQPQGTSLGTGFWWTAWIKPLLPGYLISDGYGGAHALLWGIFPGATQSATGNIWTGTTSISFSGTYGVAAGEWVWAAVGWDGTTIYTYINGICDGQTAGLTTRATYITNGHLYVGGSDHINAGCDMAYLAGWDRAYWVSVGVHSGAVQPSRFPKNYMQAPAGFADFAADYTQPGNIVRDLSASGYEETAGTYPARLHPGVLATEPASSYADAWLSAPVGLNDGAALANARPRWITDTTCPYGQPFTSPLPKEVTRTPAAVPPGALVFDSFERHNQTPAFQHHPTLGRTEGGSAGPQTWNYDFADSWGILGGKAVLTHTTSSIAWVPTGAYDQDVRVTRSLTGSNNGQVGCCFRVLNSQNFWSAFVNASTHNVYIASYAGGVASAIHQFLPGSTTWTILRVVAHGTTITAQVSVDGTTWISDPAPVTDTVSASTWTGAGVASGYRMNSSYISSLERCDNFTVFAG